MHGWSIWGFQKSLAMNHLPYTQPLIKMVMSYRISGLVSRVGNPQKTEEAAISEASARLR